MSRALCISCSLFAFAALASVSGATVTGQWVGIADALPSFGSPDYPPAVIADPAGGAVLANGYETWDLIVSLGPADKFKSATLLIDGTNLGTGGAFFQSIFGNNVRPLPAIIAISPALAYDTFADSFFGIPLQMGRADALPGPAVMDASQFNAIWDTENPTGDPAGPTSYRIGRVSLKRQDPTLPVPVGTIITQPALLPPPGDGRNIYSLNDEAIIPPIPGIPEPATAMIAIPLMVALTRVPARSGKKTERSS